MTTRIERQNCSRITLCFIVLFTTMFSLNVAAEEAAFQVVSESPYYWYDRQSRIYNREGVLKPGETIYIKDFAIGGFGFRQMRKNEPPEFRVVFFYNGGEYYHTYVKNVKPAKTKELFGDDVLVNYSVRADDDPMVGEWDEDDEDYYLLSEMWLPDYYVNVLKSRERDTLAGYEPYLLTFNRYESTPTEDAMNWYDYWWMGINKGMCMFFNAGIILGERNDFAVTDIKKIDRGYEVACISPRGTDDFDRYNEYLNWSLVKPNSTTTFLLYPDGEYMDIYVNTKDAYFGTLVKVKEEFIKQCKYLIKTNTCDLSKVQWPRRADGTMDYPPPVDMSGYRTTHTTTDRLRLRNNPNASSLIVTTMEKGAEVQVVETGGEAVIDGIRAAWVKVFTGTGYSGWCFAGYLEPVAETAGQDTPGEAAGEQPVSQDSGNAPEESDKPAEKGMPFLGIAAALLALGAAVVIIVLRKKRSRHPDDK